MADILHILNGDSTLHILQASGLEGDCCVWRDVLSDGPAIEAVGSEEYWQARQDYMVRAFDTTPEGFDQKARTEFDKMTHFSDYQEVVLWFEYDLFCQINLIAIMHWFSLQDRGETKVSLVCVGREEGYDQLVALGELPPEKYPDLFSRRRIMGSYDFTFASDAYQAWCSTDPTDLDNYILMSSNEFPYLSDALRSHQKRFPSAQSGLTEIEAKAVTLIQEGVNEAEAIVSKLLRWQDYQGFGDLQYRQVLDRIKPLLKEDEKLALSAETEDLLKAGEAINLINRDYSLGGASATEWCWDENTNELISREISS